MSSSSSSPFYFTDSTSSILSMSSAHKADSHESIGMSEEASKSKVWEDHVDVASGLAAEVDEDDLARRAGYKWASSHVTHHFSKYQWSSMVESYVAAYRIFVDDIPNGAISFERCSAVDNVVMGEKITTPTSSSCMHASSQTRMCVSPLTSSPWACSTLWTLLLLSCTPTPESLFMPSVCWQRCFGSNHLLMYFDIFTILAPLIRLDGCR